MPQGRAIKKWVYNWIPTYIQHFAGRNTNKQHQHLPGTTSKSNYKMLGSALLCTPNGDLPRPVWTPLRRCPNDQVTQIQCVCNLCGIAGPESANHANKHQAAIGQRALGSWHKKHWNLFVATAVACNCNCRFRYSCSLAFNKRSSTVWLPQPLLMQIIRNCIDYALGSQLWPLPLPFECQLKWPIKSSIVERRLALYVK